MTTATPEALTIDETRRLHRLASQLEKEATTCRLGGLEDRADNLEEEARTVRERIRAADAHRQDERLQGLKEARRMKEKAEAEGRAREEEEKRRAAARAWFADASWAGPLEAVEALRAADQAGHRPEDVLTVTRRVKRRRDGRECLAIPGNYLRRDYAPASEV